MTTLSDPTPALTAQTLLSHRKPNSLPYKLQRQAFLRHHALRRHDEIQPRCCELHGTPTETIPGLRLTYDVEDFQEIINSGGRQTLDTILFRPHLFCMAQTFAGAEGAGTVHLPEAALLLLLLLKSIVPAHATTSCIPSTAKGWRI